MSSSSLSNLKGGRGSYNNYAEVVFDVYIGKRMLSGTEEHWAIGLYYEGAMHWYEIERASNSDGGVATKT